MREVVIEVHCDLCNESFAEKYEGSNSVGLTIYGEPYEMDVCPDCIGGTFIQEARPVGSKKNKGFLCPCGKSFDSSRGLAHHKTRMSHD